ncbi:MAG: glutamate racemase [Clostridiaceae bacterium]|jgi:glutamate racemase|nr:glutamate racemase [Eubacteriales bacterium]NLV48236.1 glutamate racemase [Clostridiaceae bacterium]
MTQAYDNRPIGVFDSGLGGLTVLKDIMQRLPAENTLYFGDSGRMPYGSKSVETVTRFSLQNMRFLLDQDVKMIVIACNTASSRAYATIRNNSPVPVIEVIEPGSREAVRQSENGRIGVIGTQGTIDSQVYIKTIEKLSDKPVEIFQQACPLFVSLAEEGWWDHPVTRDVARIYLEPLLSRHIDALVLGCTHYPLLSSVIKSIAGPSVRLIHSGAAVAAVIEQTLKRTESLNNGQKPAVHAYFTSDSVRRFQTLSSLFLDQPITDIQHVDIEQYSCDALQSD